MLEWVYLNLYIINISENTHRSLHFQYNCSNFKIQQFICMYLIVFLPVFGTSCSWTYIWDYEGCFPICIGTIGCYLRSNSPLALLKWSQGSYKWQHDCKSSDDSRASQHDKSMNCLIVHLGLLPHSREYTWCLNILYIYIYICETSVK